MADFPTAEWQAYEDAVKAYRDASAKAGAARAAADAAYDARNVASAALNEARNKLLAKCPGMENPYAVA